MSNRLHTPWLIVGGSVVLVAGLGALLLWNEKPEKRPLVVYCAPALREPMEEIRKIYEESGQKIEITYGKSAEILTKMKLSKRGDIFFPADESFVLKAKNDGLVEDVFPVARMRAVLVVSPNQSNSIRDWDDLVSGDRRVAQASPGAAIRDLTQGTLESLGKWSALKQRTIDAGDVGEVPNAVRFGSRVEAGIVWDAMLAQPSCKDLDVVRLPELDAVAANVKIAVVAGSSQKKEASDFAFFVASSCRDIWTKHGYRLTDEAVPAPKKQPDTQRAEIVLYAGSMLRPAIEETIAEFEKQEGVKVIRVYNGCGILVGQMKAGKTPDAYFACDPSFMNQVEDLFESPKIVSKNQLVIAVPKGNPNQIKTLVDLGKPGLKIGVGHEQQCALGVITRGVFIRSKVYKAVMENVKVQSPTGDLLINQLRAKSLDAVVAYVSNVKPYADELDAIKVEEVNCAPAQPFAVSRSTAHADVTKRLLQALESAQSKERFEKLGFGWEVKP